MLKVSTRFSVAIHILALLEIVKDRPCSSKLIASSVNTNPVVIRRLLGLLKRANLVKTTAGTAGVILTKAVTEINLLEIYHAVDARQGTLFEMHQHPNQACPVGANIQAALKNTIMTTQTIFETALASHSLAEIIQYIQKQAQLPISDFKTFYQQI